MFKIFLLTFILTFVFTLLSSPAVQAQPAGQALKCARTVSEIAEIPELNALVRATAASREGTLANLIGTWKTQVAWVTAWVDFSVGENGFNTRVRTSEGKDERSLNSALCYAGPNTAYMVGADGKVNAFIEVTNGARSGRPYKPKIRIAEAKIQNRVAVPKDYYAFERQSDGRVMTADNQGSELIPRGNSGRTIASESPKSAN